MGKSVPLHLIPDNEVLPKGIVEVECQSLKRVKYDDPDKPRTWLLAGRVTAPAEFEGFPFFDRLFLGTKEDPEADDSRTWRSNRNCIRAKKLLLSAGINGETIEDEAVIDAEIKNVKVLASVDLYKDKGKNNPEYKGQLRNAVRAYFIVGSKEPKVDEASFDRVQAQELD